MKGGEQRIKLDKDKGYLRTIPHMARTLRIHDRETPKKPPLTLKMLAHSLPLMMAVIRGWMVDGCTDILLTTRSTTISLMRSSRSGGIGDPRFPVLASLPVMAGEIVRERVEKGK
jgi:hypothetical protein